MKLASQIEDAKILVVDDEPHNVHLLRMLLKRGGFHKVEGVVDPRDFFDRYSSYGPDLILLDLNMPDIDGFQIMTWLEEHGDDEYLPVLILTGDGSTDTCRRALGMGAKDFVTKPFDPWELVSRVRNLVETRLLHKRLALQNMHLEAAVAERTRELEDAHYEVVRRLGMAAEYRDDDTGMHIQRMSLYCAALGRAFGFSEQQVKLLRYAAVLHDVGKIGIEDAILLKKGRLTPQEWEKMKMHTVIGAELLSGGKSEVIRLAEQIARFHHERWDGTGYPDGLAREEIPLPARIAAVCDVFDALTSTRPYKKAWTVEEAVAEIRCCSGTQFDPKVVERFLEILPEILSIKSEYSHSSGKEPDEIRFPSGSGGVTKSYQEVAS